MAPAVTVRRAKLSDADAIAAFVNDAWQRALGTSRDKDRAFPISRHDVRSVSVGLLMLPSDGRLVGYWGGRSRTRRARR